MVQVEKIHRGQRYTYSIRQNQNTHFLSAIVCETSKSKIRPTGVFFFLHDSSAKSIHYFHPWPLRAESSVTDVSQFSKVARIFQVL